MQSFPKIFFLALILALAIFSASATQPVALRVRKTSAKPPNIPLLAHENSTVTCGKQAQTLAYDVSSAYPHEIRLPLPTKD